MGEFAIGQAVPRFEDPRLLRGGGRYVDDIVLPGMAFGHVLRSPHAHARITSIDTATAKAAPGVLAVLTGADWAGLRLGRPAGRRRHEAPRRLADLPAALSGAGQGPGALGRRLRRLRRRRDQAPGGGRRRTDRGRLRAAAGRRLDRRGAPRPARRWSGTTARTTSASSHLDGDKAATEAAFAARRPCRQAALRHQPRHRGDDGAARLRSATTTRPTTATRSTPPCSARIRYRAELAQIVLKVPESKVRVVAGDIGGSFGMKSAIYNEVALVLLGVEADRPAGEMDEHALGGVPLRRAGARQRHRRRAGARQGRHFPRPSASRPIVNVGAYLQIGHSRPSSAISARSPASTARRRCTSKSTAVFTHTNPMRPYRGNGRPEAAYVIERMVDRRGRRTRHRPGRAAPAQLHPARGDAVQDRPDLHLRLRRVREEHGPGARSSPTSAGFASATRGIEEARQAARPRHVQHHRARRGARASKAPKSASTAAARCTMFSGCDQPGPGPRDRVQADGVRPARHRIRTRSQYIQGDTDKVFFGEGTGGSRSATMARLGVPRRRPKRSIAKAKAIAAHMLKVDVGRRQFRRRHLLQRQDQPDHDHQGRGARPRPTRRSCRRTWRPGWSPPRSTRAEVENFPERRATSARSRSTPRPARSRSCATTWSTTSAR